MQWCTGSPHLGSLAGKVEREREIHPVHARQRPRAVIKETSVMSSIIDLEGQAPSSECPTENKKAKGISAAASSSMVQESIAKFLGEVSST
jgi:hypothetical protein